MGVVITDIYSHGDNFGAHYFQDNTPILNLNYEQRKNSDENWSNADKDIKQVGRVPKLVWLLWEQMGITNDTQELMKALERHEEWKTTTKRLA